MHAGGRASPTSLGAPSVARHCSRADCPSGMFIVELLSSLLLVAGTDWNCTMSGDCSGCTIGGDDIGSCTEGTSIAGIPISDGLALLPSAIESLKMPVSEAPTSPSTEELLRRPALSSLYSRPDLEGSALGDRWGSRRAQVARIWPSPSLNGWV